MVWMEIERGPSGYKPSHVSSICIRENYFPNSFALLACAHLHSPPAAHKDNTSLLDHLIAYWGQAPTTDADASCVMR